MQPRWILGVLAGLLIATQSLAQSFAEINAGALAAFNAGNIERATQLTLEAVNKGEDQGRAEPSAFLQALNNLVFLQNIGGPVSDEQVVLAERAIRFAEDTELLGTGDGLLAMSNAARANTTVGNLGRSKVLRQLFLSTHRGGELHGMAVTAAVDIAFQNQEYTPVPLLIEEMITVTGGYFAETTLDKLFEQQELLEEQGDVEGVSALVDARILWVGATQPQFLEEFSHVALWPKFFLNYQAENFGAAAQALRVWANTGTLSAEESAFIQDQAASALTLTQLQGFSDRSGVQLGYAELTVAFAELAYPADDPRIALALRERAFAESQLNLFDRASETLQDALSLLSQSGGAHPSVYLILEDLAANAWQRGDLDQAHALFERASAAYEIANAEGDAPLTDLDHSILFLNRARLQVERGALIEAEDYLSQANTHFTRYVESGVAKKNDLWHNVGLAEAAASLASAQGDTALALTTANDVVSAANEYFPETHPARARAITNAADQLLVLGETDKGRGLLQDALKIAKETLPQNASLTTEISLKLAIDALVSGVRDDAISIFRDVIDARRSPEFRDAIADVSLDFEMFAWALLSQTAPSLADVDEALAALQWTQSSQSAESYAMMAARLAADDVAVSTLIKQWQDARVKLDRNRSALSSAYAFGEDPTPILGRQKRLQSDLTQADNALNSAEIALTGQAAISPLTLSDIQARLGGDEVLVTFLLPGLSSDVIPGLEVSSNLAIAIRNDAYEIAVIPEESRGVLNGKIDAFRCEMAISDDGCGAGTTDQLRGSMSLDEPEKPESGFDWAVAHDLYRDLFGGVETLLQPDDHLIIVPPSDLLRLPFQALLTDVKPDIDLASADWLIRRYAISVLPSIAAFDVLKNNQSVTQVDAKFLGVGDPVIGSAPDMNCEGVEFAALRSAGELGPNLYGSTRENGVRLASTEQLRQMQRLPDATCELRAIEGAFGTDQSDILIREQATETELKRLSASGDLHSYDLIVFATHGVVSGETSAIAPGLVLTPPSQASLTDDGLLTAAEVANLSLSARLVILSACNTAAGSDAGDEGLSGLASGFFHAGARSLMVTHWAVFSDASARISSNVSKEMAADKTLPIARALRRVVVDILQDGDGSFRSKHPAYWAPFSIVGY